MNLIQRGTTASRANRGKSAKDSIAESGWGGGYLGHAGFFCRFRGAERPGSQEVPDMGNASPFAARGSYATTTSYEFQRDDAFRNGGCIGDEWG
jgi:hypothetical protein